MTKKLTYLLMYLLCYSIYATSSTSILSSAINCTHALASNDPGFCISFRIAAQCHCTSAGLPIGMCTNMKLLFQRMVSTFGTVRRACEFQKYTSTQNCIDNWNCYNNGGNNSAHQLCNSTGNVCE